MSWTAADKVDRRTAFQAAVATTTLNAAPFIYCWLRDTNPVALFGLAMVLIWIILVVAARLEFDAMATAQRPSQMQTRSKVDIKCVHAQLADHLCRSESNGLAAELVQRLEARGVDVRGNDECRTQCDMSVPESAARASWWYEPAKNKWKLRKRQHRRVQARVDKRAAEREGPAEGRVAAGPGVRVSGLGGRPQGDAVVR